VEPQSATAPPHADEASAPSEVPASRAPPESFWASVFAALRGTDQDFTEGSLHRAILLLAVPMVLEMSMESLFGLVDVFFVSRLGPAAVAAVGLTESLLTVLYTVAMGISMAATASVARRMGEKNPTEASRAAAQSLWLGLAFALPIGAAGVWFAPDLLRLMGASPEVQRIGAPYTRLALGGDITVLLLFILNGIFRGAGDAATAMRSLIIANGINIVLNPCFILGLGPFPKLGLLGAAVATTCGRGIGVLYQLRILFGGKARVWLNREVARIRFSELVNVFRLGLGGMGQSVVSTFSWILLMRITARFGEPAVAGYTLALRIIVVALMPAFGLSNAAATLVGQNLGAGKPERAESSVWRTGLYNVVFLGLISVVFLALASQIVSPFILAKDESMRPYAVDCLRYVAAGYLFYAYGMVAMQAFNGAGDTVTPTVINFICFWIFQLPAAWLLANTFGMGAQGVFLAITLAQSLSAFVSILAFRSGRWKLAKA